jgi:magnesium chelatase family protein
MIAILSKPRIYPLPRTKNMSDCVHPCPCGYYGDPLKPCTCAPSTVTKYQKRISGPLLDRIDIHIEVPRVEYEKLSSDRLGESSGDIRRRVEAARQRQRERFDSVTVRRYAGVRRASEVASPQEVMCNADMRVAEIRKFCKLEEKGGSLIRAATSCCA